MTIDRHLIALYVLLLILGSWRFALSPYLSPTMLKHHILRLTAPKFVIKLMHQTKPALSKKCFDGLGGQHNRIAVRKS